MKKIAFTNSFLTKRNRKESVLTIELSITGEDFSDLSILPELYSEINSLANRLSEKTNGDLGKRK
ncbi:hypothetical protein K4A18_002959 [Listeria monocytogenes]|uniref:Uncharacterized protein n=1 Tax=Listeria monocytogenes TaxID=1639 RepID=A0AB37NIB3_LISMN|nr:hypothetical protein [Listeria monocytogenes]EEI9985940.1 hypothetical protein [Listeria innocua]AGR03218.1 hypothetical protein M642_09740 [Listeria monocytogenes]EAC3417808.1 hypothetical protein [Listeria monocytogenes]EAC4100510.1 hypothetical protein [Listeria monocytogenes]EAC4122015.1 hypothetical protein [Listeria monocytogenes]